MKKSTTSLTIAISGASETGHCGPDAMQQAKELGRISAQHKSILLTPATSGFPLWVAMGAHEAGGTVVGFSPATSMREHRDIYRLPDDHIDVPIFTGFGATGRDLVMVRSADAIIFGCGNLESVHEFSLALQEKKVIGILKGNWTSDRALQVFIDEYGDKAEHLIIEEQAEQLIAKIAKVVKK